MRATFCLLSLTGLLLSPFAHAGECAAASKLLFQCTTSKGKQILLCDSGKTIDYSFGPRGKPEIVVRAKRDEASTTQWHGMGRYMNYSVDVPNRDVSYSVYWGVDRLDEQHPVEAGVYVMQGETELATVKCDGRKPIVQRMEGVTLREVE